MTPLLRLLLLAVFQGDIDALGSPDFATRQRAEARLARHADLVYPLLDRPFGDLEQQRRARRIVAGVLPQSYSPVALLGGRVVPEWASGDGKACCIGPRPASDDWRLTYLKPEGKGPLGLVARCYGERARTQWQWTQWDADCDGREATRLLVRDLLALGVPPCAARGLLDVMSERERKLSAWRYGP